MKVGKPLPSRAFAFALALALAPFAPAQDDDGGYTREQQLLFGTPHLANVGARAALYYDFRQRGAAAEVIEDREILLEITDVSDDGMDLETAFLDEAGKRTYAVENFRSNPMLMFFLEWDVSKMDDASVVSRHYYRNLLRGAFRNAGSEEVTFAYGGRDVTGHKVFFDPLASKKGDPKYKNYPAKRYEFIVADDVPGGIYSIATRIPAAGEVLEYTEMKFNRIEPATAFTGAGAGAARPR